MNCRKETFDRDHRSTFPIQLILVDCQEDELPISSDFRLIFLGSKSGNNKFEVSQKDGKMENCYVENGELFARFENHNLGGLLVFEIWEFFEDKNAGAGYWRCVRTEDALNENGQQIRII